FQIIPHAPPRYKVKMITRTSAQADYVEGSEDGYKRTELLADFRIRNYIKPQCLPPETPTITSVTGLNSSYPCTIHVSWTEVTEDVDGEDLSSECGISDYIVTYANTAETKFYTAYPGTATSCELDISSILRDPNHQTYYISVVAVNCSGLSAYPTEQTISDSSPPAAPDSTGISAIAEGHAITVSWTDKPDCDVAEYHIYRSPHDASGFEEIAKVPVIDPSVSMTYSYRDENLTCNSYYYRIKAYDYTYWSSYSNPSVQETIVDSNAPTEPTNFSFTKGTSNLIFSWNLASDDPFGFGEGYDDVTEYSLCPLGGGTCISVPAGQTSINFDANSSMFTYSDFSIQSVDICGNLSSAVTQPTECQDTVIVSLSYSCPSGSSCDWSETIDIYVTASSSNTLIQGELNFDNGSWIPLEGTSGWNYSLNASALGVGTHIITARVKDSADCIGTALLLVEVYDSAGNDVTPPVFGDIIQDPETSPIPADQNVSVCVAVTDDSGIFSVILTTDFEEITMAVTDPNQANWYCGTIPPHNGSTIYYDITATDNTSNQNQTTISSGYAQYDSL
ncbi:fibronectin type III domain-containing protein, partial [bacterium]|nr:fibronectin type III domain-containing protein [bacterium]